MAGHGDKIVGNCQAERLHAAIPGSVLCTVEDVGHMVHHVAAREVVEAVAEVMQRSSRDTPADRHREPEPSRERVPRAARSRTLSVVATIGAQHGYATRHVTASVPKARCCKRQVVANCPVPRHSS